MFVVMNNTLFIVFQELTDTGSNVHDKRNSRFSMLVHFLVGGFCPLPVFARCMGTVYLHACIFFPGSHVTSREILVIGDIDANVSILLILAVLMVISSNTREYRMSRDQ